VIFLSFFVFGAVAPFILTLGYIWVDTFRPQDVAWFVMDQLPVAQLTGFAAVAAYFLLDRRAPPRFTFATLLVLLLAAWITLTMLWAEVPSAGWSKWDWAFKSVLFSAFIPWAIRSRVQIEAFVQIYVLALAANFVPFGAKVIISGGGYGQNLGLQTGNANLSEGELLSTVVLMAIPLALYLGRHTQLLPRTRLFQLGYTALVGAAVLTALGTHERSALVGMVGLGGYMLMRSRHKVAFGLCLAAIGVAIVVFMSSEWTERMATVNDVAGDDSAMTRLLVWQWTLEYALANPFGGGFNSFVINRLEHANGHVEFGRAYQSIYFEMLGAHGWVGLGLFLGVTTYSFVGLRRLARRTRTIPHLAWCADLSDALQAGMVVFATAGAFVDIAFQPEIWYFIALSISLREYVRRAEHKATVPVSGWRTRLAGATPAPSLETTWRSKQPRRWT
jgi:probable O-glycosylation ligase (exosortase A-associated)